MSYEQQLQQYVKQVNVVLARHLPADTVTPTRLHQAMRYAVLSGGKRIRPLLAYATAELLELPSVRVDAIAASLEYMHAYSLIHDDLPAMDDDDLRRNMPTIHIAFDEATAILAGDGLQALAFEVLAIEPQLTQDANARIKIIAHLARAAGISGMVAGQALDMAAEGQSLTLAELENLHRLKTGQLLAAAILMPCYLSAYGLQLQPVLMRVAECIGLAFQIRDDIIDVESDTATLGKPQGSDQARGKVTYPALLGIERAKQLASQLQHEARTLLNEFGEKAQGLQYLVGKIVTRTY